jgi:hypothetical protein
LCILNCGLVSAAEYRLLDADTPQGPVSVVFTTDAEALSLARDLTATLTATGPDGAVPALPPIDALRDRFEGFSIAEGFSTAEGTIRWRLRADPAAPRYRLAPFAVTAGDESFVASPVLFPLASLPDAQGGIEISPRKFFVWPSPRTLLRWILAATGAAVVAALLWLAVRRIRHAVKVRRMSPAQRALYELSQLLGRGLVERGLFKDYYVELTHVVRRYIERSYGIRAPRLTTEEFLDKAKSDGRFSESSVVQLSDFLRSADMVKFAGLSATIDMASQAAAAARRYIEHDGASAANPQPAASYNETIRE